MKKTLNNIFDDASASDIETFLNQNPAPDVPAEVLSSIKNKVYSKTGIVKHKNKSFIAFRWKFYVAIAVCFIFIISLGIFIKTIKDNGDFPIIDSPDNTSGIPIIDFGGDDEISISSYDVSTNESGYITGDESATHSDDVIKNESIAPPDDTSFNENSNDTDTSTDVPPVNNIPSYSTITLGNKITGQQYVSLGTALPNEAGNLDMLAPGFEINTIIEAEIIEVLPDTYYYADSYYLSFHIAKLRVLDQIIGKDLPQEIFLCYPYYDTNVFEGYERFILSLEQVGVENYMLVNETQSRVDYFSNMFEVIVTRDLGYGSVIAFNEGKVDESFWDKVEHNHSSNTIKNMMGWDSYPVSKDSTTEDAKENILKLAKNVNGVYRDYITIDDIFISKEGKEIQEYIAPSSTNVFRQEIYIREDRIIARYTRVINGFLTDEVITINGYNGENGNVLRSGSQYTTDDLSKLPNIGNIITDLKLFELTPPHITISEEMEFRYCVATGVYRKADENIYGIIRIMWYYSDSSYDGNSYQMDDMYYLYDENGNGFIVERGELQEIIGNDNFIQRFPYDSVVSWD